MSSRQSRGGGPRGVAPGKFIVFDPKNTIYRLILYLFKTQNMKNERIFSRESTLDR